MARLRPFDSEAALFEAAERVWWGLAPADWLEAFAAHPKIGDRDAMRAKFAATAAWSAREQAGVDGAPEDVLQALAEANVRYDERFGYIFIVCATGKTAEEMLALLRERLSQRSRDRDPDRRRRAGEDHADPPGEDRTMSPITTHVLDTATRQAGPGDRRAAWRSRAVRSDRWTELARGVTDDDGRIGEFDPPLASLEPEVYRLRFDTGAYFKAIGVRAFYPEVHVVVRIDDPAQHYHIPLLLSPFGYSTYRGS